MRTAVFCKWLNVLLRKIAKIMNNGIKFCSSVLLLHIFFYFTLFSTHRLDACCCCRTSVRLSVCHTGDFSRNVLCITRLGDVSSFRPRRSRRAAVYSRHTFPVDNLSVGMSVHTCVRRSVQCILEKRQIRSGCRLAS